ncbi:hypothetical protein [Pseudoalteromonas distincta]|nr:hypothetical protein [Pseudoalteromonas distincta]
MNTAIDEVTNNYQDWSLDKYKLFHYSVMTTNEIIHVLTNIEPQVINVT